jgi:2-haloalkanoic acid dehalogenase type II
MAPPYEIITFDCYGTLIDWESGIRAAFSSAGLDPERALSAYAELEPEVEHERYRSYREVLTITAERVAERLGAPKRARFLAESLPSWKPFGDTNPALERLRGAGIRLGILSNVDDDLLAETRKHFTVDFDLIVTAQQVRSYKPGEAHFREARRRMGDARWLHAAQSNFHDVVPANALAIDSAWINRHGEKARPGGVPKYEFRNLAEFAEAMTTP